MIPQWKTKAGNLIPINELEDDHLESIIKMIRRKGGLPVGEFFRLLAAPLYSMGDYAAMAVEMEQAQSFPSKWLDVLEDESNRRKPAGDKDGQQR
jgi:hypothetical protein